MSLLTNMSAGISPLSSVLSLLKTYTVTQHCRDLLCPTPSWWTQKQADTGFVTKEVPMKYSTDLTMHFKQVQHGGKDVQTTGP